MFDLRRWLTLLAAMAGLAGCLDDRMAGSTGVGNPTKGTVTVAMQAASGGILAKRTATAPRNPDGSFDIRDAGGTVFTVKSCHANVGRIKLGLPQGVGCAEADETECDAGEVIIRGPFVADLMTGKWQPAPGPFKVPVGVYGRMDVRLESADEKQPGPDPDLADHSMIIKGVFAYQGKSDRSFSIALDFNEDATFPADSALQVSAGTNNLIVVLDIEKWLSGSDITGCLQDGSLALDTQGNLSVDKSKSCGTLDNDLKDAVKGSGRIKDNHQD